MSKSLETPRPKTPVVLLSFDVEEFDIPEEYGQRLSAAEKLSVSAQGMEAILDLLDELKITSTCFTTAVFAQGRPDLFRRLATRHEIASHAFDHSTFCEEDLLRSRLALEEMAQVPVTGFRRPRFAPTRPEAIVEAGYRYNSSEHPIWLPGRYQHFFHPRLPYRAGPLWQIPVTASPIIRFPFFWLSFKNLPITLFQLMSHWTLQTDGFLNLIFHPWEFADLRGYQLPGIVKRPDGGMLVERLRNYLQFLAAHAQFITFTSFIHGHLD